MRREFSIGKTPFPTRPGDVAPLTVREFTFALHLSDAPSFDVVCARFEDDANRALVWLLRFRALNALSDRADMTEWLSNHPRTSPAVCQVAATFELNDRWEFDKEAFCSAVDMTASKRSRVPSSP
jgi:hypothetical protein